MIPIEEILKNHPAFLDESIDELEASKFSGIPETTLRTKRCRGGGPPYYKSGRSIHYTRRDLIDWREQHRQTNTMSNGAAG